MPVYWSVEFIVTADPVAEVVTFVPPVKVIVPEEVIGVMEPESDVAPTLVTVPVPLAVSQLALPPESLVRTLPTPGLPPYILSAP